MVRRVGRVVSQSSLLHDSHLVRTVFCPVSSLPTALTETCLALSVLLDPFVSCFPPPSNLYHLPSLPLICPCELVTFTFPVTLPKSETVHSSCDGESGRSGWNIPQRQSGSSKWDVWWSDWRCNGTDAASVSGSALL